MSRDMSIKIRMKPGSGGDKWMSEQSETGATHPLSVVFGLATIALTLRCTVTALGSSEYRIDPVDAEKVTG